MHHILRRLSTSSAFLTISVLVLSSPAAAAYYAKWETPACDAVCQTDRAYVTPRLPELVRIDVSVTSSTGTFSLPNCQISSSGLGSGGCLEPDFRFYAPGAVLVQPDPASPTQALNGCWAVNRYTDGTSAQGPCGFSHPNSLASAGTGTVRVQSNDCTTFSYSAERGTPGFIEFRDATGARWTVTNIEWQAAAGKIGTVTHPGTIWVSRDVLVTAQLGDRVLQLNLSGMTHSTSACENGIPASNFRFTVEGSGHVV